MQTTEPYRPPDDPPPTLEYIGISPAWRIIALVGILASTLLLFIVVMLLISLAHVSVSPVVTPAMPAPVMGAVPGPAVAIAADNEEDLGAAEPGELPVPRVQDLRPEGTFPVVEEDVEPRQRPTPRGEFLRNAHSIWTNADGKSPGRLLVSPDGSFFAYHDGLQMRAGIAGALHPIVEQDGWANAAGFGMPAAGMGAPPGTVSLKPLVPLAPSGWSADSARVYWANHLGHIVAYDSKGRRFFQTPMMGEAAVPVGHTGNFVLLRTRPRLKIEGPGAVIPKDTTEILIADNAGVTVRTLLTDDAIWRTAAVSAEGNRLAMISNKGHENAKLMRWQVFLFDLADEKPAPKPVGPSAERIESVCWTQDGSLIYARSQTPLPPDHLHSGPLTENAACDLFEFDLKTNKETRLTRGGGFSCPLVTTEKDLWFVVETRQPGGVAAQLMRMPLKTLREYLEQETADIERVANLWKSLIDETWKTAGLTLDGAGLTADLCAKADAAFRKSFLNQFKDKPPGGIHDLERLRKDAMLVRLDAKDQGRLEVILGVLEGEYLRQRLMGTNWHLSAGPLVGKSEKTQENTFGVVYNPFRPLVANGAKTPLARVLFEAAGRPLILSNEPTQANQHLEKLVDADLQRLDPLLAGGKTDEADRLTRELFQRHSSNFVLLRSVGERLARANRLDVLRELLQKHAALPPDPVLHNLLGVALLPGDKAAAIKAFRDALRCDLKYGPAYLNLAQAYQENAQPADARASLLRYLKLMPQGDLASDARRRLMQADTVAAP